MSDGIHVLLLSQFTDIEDTEVLEPIAVDWLTSCDPLGECSSVSHTTSTAMDAWISPSITQVWVSNGEDLGSQVASSPSARNIRS